MRYLNFFVVCLCLLVSSQVLGHARLMDARPAEGEVLDQSPAYVFLQFSEPLELRFSNFGLHALGADPDAEPAADNQLPMAEPVTDEQQQDVELSPTERLQPGWYAVVWEVLARDGHATRGVLRFRVDG